MKKEAGSARLHEPVNVEKKPKTFSGSGFFNVGVPKRIRTAVPTVKGLCPRPLDDRDLKFGGG